MCMKLNFKKRSPKTNIKPENVILLNPKHSAEIIQI